MKTPARSKKQVDEPKQPIPYIEDNSDEYYTGRRLSLVDRLHFGDDPLHENSLYELGSLSGCISRAVAASSHKDTELSPLWTPADEISELLLTIKKAIETDTEGSKQEAIEVIDIAVELAFLHSPAYKAALKLFEIEHLCAMASDDERSAFDAIRAHITRAVAQEKEGEVKRQ